MSVFQDFFATRTLPLRNYFLYIFVTILEQDFLTDFLTVAKKCLHFQIIVLYFLCIAEKNSNYSDFKLQHNTDYVTNRILSIRSRCSVPVEMI